MRIDTPMVTQHLGAACNRLRCMHKFPLSVSQLVTSARPQSEEKYKEALDYHRCITTSLAMRRQDEVPFDSHLLYLTTPELDQKVPVMWVRSPAPEFPRMTVFCPYVIPSTPEVMEWIRGALQLDAELSRFSSIVSVWASAVGTSKAIETRWPTVAKLIGLNGSSGKHDWQVHLYNQLTVEVVEFVELNIAKMLMAPEPQGKPAAWVGPSYHAITTDGWTTIQDVQLAKLFNIRR